MEHNISTGTTISFNRMFKEAPMNVKPLFDWLLSLRQKTNKQTKAHTYSHESLFVEASDSVSCYRGLQSLFSFSLWPPPLTAKPWTPLWLSLAFPSMPEPCPASTESRGITVLQCVADFITWATQQPFFLCQVSRDWSWKWHLLLLKNLGRSWVT